MFSGGWSDGFIFRAAARREAMNCQPVLANLYYDFAYFNRQLSELENDPTPVLEKPGTGRIELIKQSGPGWMAYSRKYTTKEGKPLTVQMAAVSSKYTGHVTFALKIFGEKGKELAHVREDDECRSLLISQEQRNKGLDVLVKSALKAVTGRDFEVAVE